MRGKFAVGHVLANRAGLIPARAGKIARPCRWSSRPRAHPRACGENVVDDAPLTAAEGSSPRVRGKSGQHAGSSRGAGLIPARAGKIRSTPPAPPWAAAHPRACGENSPLVWRRTIHTGSSPRVRGKFGVAFTILWNTGLIPARAGKIAESAAQRAPHKAHPRACGENLGDGLADSVTQGSSPRVRGKCARRGGRGWDRRLIPARAGKISSTRPPVLAGPAHPRACGENIIDHRLIVRIPGSSPRVRGKWSRWRKWRAGRGLIPARAGKIAACGTCASGWSAHPRACGENAPGQSAT